MMKTLTARTTPISTATRRFRPSLILLLLFLCGTGAGTGARAATLEPEALESREGYYQLTWTAEEPVRLVQASEPDFNSPVLIYTGNDSGHVASGLSDGTRYYRLESADGSRVLSNVATITVQHHSLQRAIGFFAIGAAVFIATVVLIMFTRPDDA